MLNTRAKVSVPLQDCIRGAIYFLVTMIPLVICLVAQVNTPIVVGTQPRIGEFFKTYTINTERKLNVTLLSAAYAANPIQDGEKWHLPNRKGKFILLKFRMTNVGKTDWNMNQGYMCGFKATVLDSESENVKSLDKFSTKTGKLMGNINLKPGQLIEVYKIMEMAADTAAVNLILEPGDGKPGGSITYNLGDKIAPLPVWSATQNPYEVRKNVSVVMNELVPFDKTWMAVSDVVRTGPSERTDLMPRATKGFAKVMLKLQGVDTIGGSAGMWRPETRLIATSGQSYTSVDWLRLRSGANLNGLPALDEKIDAMLLFDVPPGEALSKLVIADPLFGRKYEFRLDAGAAEFSIPRKVKIVRL